MAIGRMIAKKIGASLQVHNLVTDTSRLAFTWAITHLDSAGRIFGDPCVLKSIVFPRRTDITPEIMEAYIAEWAENGLVTWYEVDGDRYLSFPGFSKNQPGMRADREAPSQIPPPEAGKAVTHARFLPEPKVVRTNSGVTPDQLRTTSGAPPEPVRSRSGKGPRNGMEWNRKEKNRNTTDGASAPPPPAVDETSLFSAIKAAFLSKNGSFTNWGRECKNIKLIEVYAAKRDPEDPAALACSMINRLWELKAGADKFWKGQPFTPSTLVSLWDRVLETMRANTLDPEIAALIKGFDVTGGKT